MYDKKVKEVLEKAGWYEGRKLDISEKVAKLEECGCKVFDKAIEFLQEFDELKIPKLPPFAYSDDCHIFDINIIINFLMSQPKEERKRMCERICNNTDSKEKTIWIGRIAGGEMELFITESGKIVTDIFIIGNTIEESIENLVKDRSISIFKTYYINPKDTTPSINGFRIKNGNTFYEYTGNDAYVVIPDDITTIGNVAFSECRNLKSIIIPDNVTKIGGNCFCGCINLEYVSIPESVETIQGGAFNMCSSLTMVHLPTKLTKISPGLFERCVNLNSIIIPISVRKIENDAFLGCKNLQEIVIPENVEMIGRNVFDSCTALKNVEFHNGLKKILPLAFYNCKGLENIVLPDSITSVGEYAFEQCDNLKTVSIPETLTNIGKDAFGNAKVIVRKKGYNINLPFRTDRL